MKKAVKFVASLVKRFIADDCQMKAAGLAFYTLQCIVPLLALLIGIAQQFGFSQYLEKELQTFFKGQEVVMQYSLNIAHSTIQHIRSGVVIIGVLLLLWTNLSLFGYIQAALDQIWKKKRAQSYFRKVIKYIVMMVLIPILLAASSSLIVFIKTQVESLQKYAESLGMILILFKLTPFVLSSLIFFLIYSLGATDNNKHKFIASVVAGTLFQIWQILYITFQVEIFNYDATYGVFAVLPLFFIWLQVSWLIVFLGAEIIAQLEGQKGQRHS